MSGCIKRVKDSKYGLTPKALVEWFASLRSSRQYIATNREILRSKTTEFARKLNELEDKNDIDVNWINRWKRQYEISTRKLCGESSSVSKEVVAYWKNSILKELSLR